MSITTSIPHVDASTALTSPTIYKALESTLWGKGANPDPAIAKQGGSGYIAEYAMTDASDCEGKIVVKANSLPKAFGGVGSRSGMITLNTWVKNVTTFSDVTTYTPINASLALNVGMAPSMPSAAQLMSVVTNVYSLWFAKLLTNVPDPARVAQLILYGNAGVLGWSPT